MIFAALAPQAAIGAVVAHAVEAAGARWKKGVVVTAEIAEALARAGVCEIVVAMLEAGDVGEDEAARRLGEALAGGAVEVERAFTGRANLFATRAGVFAPDVAAVTRVNAVDEAITLATLPALRAVVAGEMVATVKIIPFAVSEAPLSRALAAGRGALVVKPYRARPVAVVSTLLPGLKASVVDKTLRALAERLAPSGSTLALDLRVAHEPGALARALAEARAGAETIIVFGASAITDRRDVIPAALEQAGGRIAHFGMPVDPGNLLMLGRLDEATVIGAPGCARSPRENGFDWVLQRLLADIPVTGDDIRAMGVGGLLMEIVSRPQPRAGGASEDEHG